MRPSRSTTDEPASRIECSTSARSIDAVLADRRVRADVAVDQARAGADDRRAADGAALERARRPRSTTRPSTCESTSSPSMRVSMRVEDSRLASSMSSRRPGVLPPALDDVRLDAAAGVDEVLDRVGDLELAARRRLDRARGVVDRRREHVDADEREVGLRLRRLLGEPRRRGRRRARRRRSARGRAPASGGSARRARWRAKASTRSAMPPCSRLSPRYMTNGSSPRNGSAVSTACASPAGSSWTM